MAGSDIPIQNLYYLLCYSWDQLEQGELIDVSKCPSTELVDLFALVLCDGINHLARRGIEHGYRTHADELRTLRGRIDALASARRFLPVHGRAACAFDELTANTLNNQILLSTLRRLSRTSLLDKELARRVVNASRGMQGISEIELSPKTFGKVQLHANTHFYRFLLNVCELVVRCSLIDQSDGKTRFRDFTRDERAMARVFEQFLYNFFRREMSGIRVAREQITWRAESSVDPQLKLLPRMQTDITVETERVHLIVDAKYYSSSLSLHYDTPKYHSGNLYQLMSYLTNAGASPGRELKGMLIYPRVDRTLRGQYSIQGFQVAIQTVDLNRDWRSIRNELLALMDTVLER